VVVSFGEGDLFHFNLVVEISADTVALPVRPKGYHAMKSLAIAFIVLFGVCHQAAAQPASTYQPATTYWEFDSANLVPIGEADGSSGVAPAPKGAYAYYYGADTIMDSPPGVGSIQSMASWHLKLSGGPIIPAGKYTVSICYASVESLPVTILIDGASPGQTIALSNTQDVVSPLPSTAPQEQRECNTWTGYPITCSTPVNALHPGCRKAFHSDITTVVKEGASVLWVQVNGRLFPHFRWLRLYSQ
jgi:hypothetical protein